MEQIITSNRHYLISPRKQNPASHLYSQLLKLGLEKYQIQKAMGGRKVIKLLNLLEEVKKSDRPNKSQTFIEWSDALPKIKKPRQLKLPKLVKRRIKR